MGTNVVHQQQLCSEDLKEVQNFGHTSASHIRIVASSPALMRVLFSGPHKTLLILPCGPVIVSTESLFSAST
jgi:hypothetical protein